MFLSPELPDEWDKSVCTCFSSSCRHAFSCHGETVATWAPSPWERHRGGSDLGTHQPKVQSFTKRRLLAGRVQGQPSTLRGAASWNSLTLSSCSVADISRPHSSLLLFLLSSQQSTLLAIVKAWARCICAGFVSYWSLCVCARILWVTFVEIVWLFDVSVCVFFVFFQYFPVWHLWKLVSNWRGVSPAYFSSHLAKAMSVRRNLWMLSWSLFKMSPNSVTFLYGHYQIDAGGKKQRRPVCFSFVSLVWGNLQRPWPSSVPATTFCSFLLINHFLPPVCLPLRALSFFERADHLHIYWFGFFFSCFGTLNVRTQMVQNWHKCCR